MYIPVAERLRRAYPALLERAGLGLIPANSDAQNVPSFRRWRFEMKLSPPYTRYIYQVYCFQVNLNISSIYQVYTCPAGTLPNFDIEVRNLNIFMFRYSRHKLQYRRFENWLQYRVQYWTLLSSFVTLILKVWILRNFEIKVEWLRYRSTTISNIIIKVTLRSKFSTLISLCPDINDLSISKNAPSISVHTDQVSPLSPLCCTAWVAVGYSSGTDCQCSSGNLLSTINSRPQRQQRLPDKA